MWAKENYRSRISRRQRRWRGGEYAEMKLGMKLRELRQYEGLTLHELSDRCGLSISYLSDIERGRTLPSLVSCAKLAKACRLHLWVFLLGVEIDLAAHDGGGEGQDVAN